MFNRGVMTGGGVAIAENSLVGGMGYCDGPMPSSVNPGSVFLPVARAMCSRYGTRMAGLCRRLIRIGVRVSGYIPLRSVGVRSSMTFNNLSAFVANSTCTSFPGSAFSIRCSAFTMGAICANDYSTRVMSF